MRGVSGGGGVGNRRVRIPYILVGIAGCDSTWGGGVQSPARQNEVLLTQSLADHFMTSVDF